MAWLPGYAYRKPLVLTGGASGAQTDFQLDIDIAYVAAKMQADFDDIRFTQNDGTTLIDAWLESKVDSASAKTWAEFPTTPANTVEQTYYMYYGKVVANYWDGSATFIDYTDTKTTSFLGSVAIPNSGYAYRSSAQSDGVIYQFGLANTLAANPPNSMFFYPYTGNVYYIDTWKAGAYTEDGPVGSWTNDVPNLYDIEWIDASTVKFYKDDVQIGTTYTTNIPIVDMYLYFNPSGGAGSQINWQLIRKYADNPPTYQFGAEESAPTGAAPTSVFYGPFAGPLGGPI